MKKEAEMEIDRSVWQDVVRAGRRGKLMSTGPKAGASGGLRLGLSQGVGVERGSTAGWGLPARAG